MRVRVRAICWFISEWEQKNYSAGKCGVYMAENLSAHGLIKLFTNEEAVKYILAYELLYQR